MRRLLQKLVFAVLLLSSGSGAALSESATVASIRPGRPSPPRRRARPRSVLLRSQCRSAESTTRPLVRGAQKVAIVSPAIAPPLELNLFFAHYSKKKSVDGKEVPERSCPGGGGGGGGVGTARSARPSTRTSHSAAVDRALRQTPSGNYSGSRLVAPTSPGARPRGRPGLCVDPAESRTFRLVAPADGIQFLAASYANKAAGLYHVSPGGLDAARPFQLPRLYRLSPNSWGLRQPQGGLRLHELITVGGSTRRADGRRRGQPGHFRLDVDPDLEQPLEPDARTPAAGSPYSRRPGAAYLRSVASGLASQAGSGIRTRTCTD